MRIYTWHSVFCIDPPTFVNSSVNPSSFETALVMVFNSLCFLSLYCTDSSAWLLYHE
uniref:Uncharacterized protein n=1 Tax=Colobus angolensis palliatus TaxID=336983 RepID=A0A2K5J1Q8_COLAP